jgi:hypothetical protein
MILISRNSDMLDSWVRFLAEPRDVTLFRIVQTASGAHHACPPVDTEVPFLFTLTLILTSLF